jgi:hypothetical protein
MNGHVAQFDHLRPQADGVAGADGLYGVEVVVDLFASTHSASTSCRAGVWAWCSSATGWSAWCW